MIGTADHGSLIRRVRSWQVRSPGRGAPHHSGDGYVQASQGEQGKSLHALALTALALLASASGSALAADTCLAQVPQSLAKAVDRQFPEFRLPRVADNLAEDVAYDRQQGGTGWLGVAAADLDGNRPKDFVLGLTARKGTTGLAVIALATRRGWRFHAIFSGTEDVRARQYVAVTKPGTYTWSKALQRTGSGAGPGSMTCRHSGAMVGATESTAFVYCLVRGRWTFVQTSD